MLKVNDIVEMKKKHPCGSYKWSVLRVGVDIKLQCVTCGHIILVSRNKLNSNKK